MALATEGFLIKCSRACRLRIHSLLRPCGDMYASACRKRVYKAPKAEDRPFAAPPPGSLGSLSYPEFGYVLRARQAAQRAQQAASRSQMTDAWVDAPEEDHLHDAENFGEALPNHRSLHRRDSSVTANADSQGSPHHLIYLGIMHAGTGISPACSTDWVVALGRSCGIMRILIGHCLQMSLARSSVTMMMGSGTTRAMRMAARLRSSASMTWQMRPPAGSPTMTK